MGDVSWAIEAVEKAALARARQEVLPHPPVQVAGLTLPQIMWLRADYTKRTGRNPSDIDPAAGLGAALAES